MRTLPLAGCITKIRPAWKQETSNIRSTLHRKEFNSRKRTMLGSNALLRVATRRHALRPTRFLMICRNEGVGLMSSFWERRAAFFPLSRRHQSSISELDEDNKPRQNKLEIPQRIRQKIISASDAVSLINDGDTICATGFVCQGAPEAVLKARGERYRETGSPNNLTL